MFIYSLLIKTYVAAIHLASLLGNEKAIAAIQGRKAESDFSFEDYSSFIWFHCASLGEFEQARPVIEQIKKASSEQKILLTFFSPSGYEVRKNYQLVEEVRYLPFDTEKNIKAFLNRCQPKLLCLVKYEIWPNLLTHHKGETLLFSGSFRSNQAIFKPYMKWLLASLKRIDTVMVSTKQDQKLLKQHNIASIFAGDTRIDRAISIQEKISFNKDFESFSSRKAITIVGGSIYNDELPYILELLKNTSNTNLILTGPDILPSTIQQTKVLLDKSGITWSNTLEQGIRILYIDKIGFLQTAYQYAQIAIVGGGWHRQIHNVLEPTIFKVKTIIGPKHSKFNEAKELIKEGLIIEWPEIQSIKNMDLQALINARYSSKFFEKNKGASEKVKNQIFTMLNQ